MSNLTELKPVCTVQNIINKFCYTIGMLPSSYQLSLTYEEQLLCIGKYLEETVIPALNNNAEAVLELQNLYISLKNYVDNYFDNLDVQSEINNKLDQMVSDGTFTKLIFQNLNYVTYEMYGAKLDGVSDDTQAIINCHNYANQHNLMVIQNKGIAYMPSASINNCPIINTNCDFTGLTFKFDENNDNNTVMIIAAENTLVNNNDIQSINLTETNISKLTKDNTDVMDFLIPFKNNHICFETNMSLGKRYSFDETIYYKQSFLVNDYGQLTPNNLYADMSNSSTIKMRYLPLNQEKITIKFGNILITGNTLNNPTILIRRNNVKLSNAFINKTNSSNQTEWKHSLFDIKYSANVEIEKFTGNNPTFENSGVDIVNYTLSFEQCYNISIHDCELTKGHGVFTSYFCNFINFNNNIINRFDNHYGCFGNINITNSNFMGYPCKINLGFGNANVNIINCSFNKYKENNKPWDDSCITCRSDLPTMFAGNLNITNCEFNGKNITNQNNYLTALLYFTRSEEGSLTPSWANYNLPNIVMENNNFNITNLSFRAFRISNLINQTYTLGFIKIKMPYYKTQGRSVFNLANIETSNVSHIDLENLSVNIDGITNSIIFYLFKNTNIYSSGNKGIIYNIEQGSIQGDFDYVHNYGQLNYKSGTTINLINKGNLSINATVSNNCESSGILQGNSLTVNGNARISGEINLTSLINSNNLFINGANIRLQNLTNTNSNLTITGSNMLDNVALLFQNNGSVKGNGNYAGVNSSILNTL